MKTISSFFNKVLALMGMKSFEEFIGSLQVKTISDVTIIFTVYDPRKNWLLFSPAETNYFSYSIKIKAVDSAGRRYSFRKVILEYPVVSGSALFPAYDNFAFMAGKTQALSIIKNYRDHIAAALPSVTVRIFDTKKNEIDIDSVQN